MWEREVLVAAERMMDGKESEGLKVLFVLEHRLIRPYVCRTVPLTHSHRTTLLKGLLSRAEKHGILPYKLGIER